MINRSFKFSDEVFYFIMEHHGEYSYQEMADKLNALFGTEYTRQQMKNFYIRHKLKSANRNPLGPGHVPWNKGKKTGWKSTNKYCFKKGYRPSFTLPVGTERITHDGYIKVKVADPRTWKFKHHVIWEAANGPIPEGFRVIFLDNNPQNCVLENIALVPKKVHHKMIGSNMVSTNPELTKAYINYTSLVVAIEEKERNNET